MIILDVSYAQGRIDWDALARWPELGGVMIKLTGEETAGDRPFIDPRAKDNVRAGRARGVRLGFYHFADGGKGSATGQEEGLFFLDQVDAVGGFRDGDLRPAVDVEWPPQSGRLFEIGQWAECILAIRDAVPGVRMPLTYTGPWYWPNIPDAAEIGWADESPLWIAAYTKACPAAPKPWRAAALWQFTNKGRVPGIAGDVDMNRVLVPIEELLI